VPFAWVVGDSIYGVSEIETALRRAGRGYVLGVNATSQFNSWGRKPAVVGTAAEIAGALDPSAWQRLSAGAGTKGERLFDWAYLELADLDAAEYNESLSGLWTSTTVAIYILGGTYGRRLGGRVARGTRR
jgi:SRSO17 transposase